MRFINHFKIGKPFKVPDDQKTLADDMFLEQNYNVYASASISLNRSLPDVRPMGCSNLIYGDKLPDTSVIIIFHNEILPTLLRTVYSIIERSPRTLLKEIILVDDISSVNNFGNVLERLIELLPIKVKLIRSESRIGLIRARLLGAKHATVFYAPNLHLQILFILLLFRCGIFREVFWYFLMRTSNVRMAGLNHYLIEYLTIVQR